MKKSIPYEYKASIGLREPIKKVKPILLMWAPEDMPDAVEPFAYMDDMFFIERLCFLLVTMLSKKVLF